MFHSLVVISISCCLLAGGVDGWMPPRRVLTNPSSSSSLCMSAGTTHGYTSLAGDFVVTLPPRTFNAQCVTWALHPIVDVAPGEDALWGSWAHRAHAAVSQNFAEQMHPTDRADTPMATRHRNEVEGRAADPPIHSTTVLQPLLTIQAKLEAHHEWTVTTRQRMILGGETPTMDPLLLPVLERILIQGVISQAPRPTSLHASMGQSNQVRRLTIIDSQGGPPSRFALNADNERSLPEMLFEDLVDHDVTTTEWVAMTTSKGNVLGMVPLSLVDQVPLLHKMIATSLMSPENNQEPDGLVFPIPGEEALLMDAALPSTFTSPPPPPSLTTTTTPTIVAAATTAAAPTPTTPPATPTTPATITTPAPTTTNTDTTRDNQTGPFRLERKKQKPLTSKGYAPYLLR